MSERLKSIQLSPYFEKWILLKCIMYEHHEAVRDF